MAREFLNLEEKVMEEKCIGCGKEAEKYAFFCPECEDMLEEDRQEAAFKNWVPPKDWDYLGE